MIRPVDALAPKVYFRGQSGNYENPINREMEKKLAIANAVGLSAVTGAVATAVSRSAVSSWRHAGGIGAVAGCIAMIFLGPMFLYKAGIKSFTKEKEMDVFVQENEMKKKLIADVNDAIDNKSNNLQGKIENYSKTIARKIA